jgi:hypothetical protein
MKRFKELVSLLSSEFDRYVIEHPEIGDKIPRNALVIFQIEDEEEFNKWFEEVSLQNKEEKQPVVYVKVKGFRIASILSEAVLEKIKV